MSFSEWVLKSVREKCIQQLYRREDQEVGGGDPEGGGGQLQQGASRFLKINLRPF